MDVGRSLTRFAWTSDEEAILFRIRNVGDDAIVMTLLEINHADGKREHVEKFTFADLSSGWRLSAPQAGWDLTLTPELEGKHIWHSCRIAGTINGKRATGVAAAELAQDVTRELLRKLSEKKGAETRKQIKIPKREDRR